MFCKYCGKPLVGTKCSACGKETVLVQYSTELDKLMTSKAPIGTKVIREKTYQQGIDEGYQKGLSDGYKNGLNDGRASSTITPIRTINKKFFAVICAFVFVFGSIVSWFISSKIYYNSGKHEGEKTEREAAEQYYTELIDSKYREGFEDGKAEGKNEAEKLYPTLAPTEEVSTQAPVDTPTPSPVQFEVICSRFVNSGSRKNPSPIVEDVQNILIALGYLNDKSDDGIFGPNTEDAVKSFQKDNELVDTGEVDRVTYNLMLEKRVELTEDSHESNESDETIPNGSDIPTEAPNIYDVTNTPYTTENSVNTSPNPSPSSLPPFGYFPELPFPTNIPSAEDESIA